MGDEKVESLSLCAQELGLICIRRSGIRKPDLHQPIHLRLDNTVENLLRRVERHLGDQCRGSITIEFSPREPVGGGQD